MYLGRNHKESTFRNLHYSLLQGSYKYILEIHNSEFPTKQTGKTIYRQYEYQYADDTNFRHKEI